MLFGPYWLLRRIGLGEMAEVFVATRSAPDRGPLSLVAVKRISREMSKYDEILDLFAREGRLAARLQHPRVARVFEVGEVGGRPYIAMEYVPGRDLAHVIERRRGGRPVRQAGARSATPERPGVPSLGPGPAARVVLDLCAALAYVHDAEGGDGRPLGVVHGDVTPTNILVSTGGEAKLIDFSVASSAVGDARDPTVRGTYAYMSPEQVRGEPIDRRTDIFAAGVVLWELLAGRRLFRRRANYLTLAAVVEDEVPRLADLDLDPDLARGAAALDELLGRALAKHRDRRYGEISELARDLEGLADELGWDTRPWTLQTAVRRLLSE